MFGAEEFKFNRREHLNYLPPIGSFRVTTCHPRHLHGDGAAATDRFTGPDIIGQRPDHCNGIDSRVPAKPAVLVVYEAGDIFFRQAVGRRETPLSVGGDTGAEQGAVSRLHHC